MIDIYCIHLINYLITSWKITSRILLFAYFSSTKIDLNMDLMSPIVNKKTKTKVKAMSVACLPMLL